MASITRAEAQQNAQDCLKTASEKGQEHGGLKYATMAIAWAELAKTLPSQVAADGARPFREVVS